MNANPQDQLAQDNKAWQPAEERRNKSLKPGKTKKPAEAKESKIKAKYQLLDEVVCPKEVRLVGATSTTADNRTTARLEADKSFSLARPAALECSKTSSLHHCLHE